MLPWKMFFRFFSALVLMATGGFAAGHDLPIPFATAPTEAAAPPAAPVADPSTTTTTAPVADSAPPAVDDTTTTAPAPVVAVPVSDPAPVVPPTGPAPTKPLKPTTTTTAPDPANAPTPPTVPVDGAAPSVCAAAATAVCGPATPAPSADTAARVKACQDWWNSLADAFDHNGRPEWATQARAIAGRCEAMITQWQQMEQRWEDRHNKGDHNGDGHPDNGWKQGKDDQGDGDHQSPPPAQATQPAPPQAKQVSRHGEGRQ